MTMPLVTLGKTKVTPAEGVLKIRRLLGMTPKDNHFFNI